MAIINIEDLQKIRKKYRDKKIVFCTGSFDLPHAGHILFFEDCKKYGDILVVSVGCDAIVKINKGNNRPILNEHIRIKTIDSFKPVDYCLLDNVSTKENPLYLLDVMLSRLKPDFYIANSESLGGMAYREEICKKLGINFIKLERNCPPEFDNVSTSSIIEKIRD